METERIPTLPQNSGRIPTIPQNQLIFQKQNPDILLAEDKYFTGQNGTEFFIKASEVVSKNSGESQIFKAYPTDNDRRVYIAKILKSVTPHSDPERRETRNQVIAFLNQYSRKSDAHLLPLIDYGEIEIENQAYYIEFYPYCEHGDLGRKAGMFTIQDLKEKIIPAVNRALHLLHQNGFLHRDVKPDNLYYYHNQIVLGDFGITCRLREDGFASDKFKTGTLGYYAPELMSQSAIIASDYYSFGQTLWTLYAGEMMYAGILRRTQAFGPEEQRNQINFAMMNNTFYGFEEIEKEDKFFEVLIRGLLQYAPSRRFGYAKVIRWLSGDRSLTREVDMPDSGVFTEPLRLFGEECWDKNEVGNLLFRNWDKADAVIYNGFLKDFMGLQEFEATRFLDGIMKKYAHYPEGNISSQDWKKIGLVKTILYFQDYKYLCWENERFTSLKDLAECVQSMLLCQTRPEAVEKLLELNLLSEWYSHQPNKQDTVLEILNSIRSLFMTGDELSMNTAFHWLALFSLESGQPVTFRHAKTLNEFVSELLSKKNLLYQEDSSRHCLLVEDPKFMAVLCMWGYEEAVHILLYSAQYETLAKRFYLLLTFFETSCTGETVLTVRKYYHDFGTESYLYWLQQNLNLYLFFGKYCKKIEAEILLLYVSASAPIQEQREMFAQLEALAEEFQDYYDNNYFMSALGLSCMTENDCITSNLLSAEWGLDFLGRTVPIGFKYYLEI